MKSMATEKTFEELIKDYSVKMDGITTFYLQPKTVLNLLKQVREATTEEFSQALLGVALPGAVVKKIGKIISTPDRILITENEE